MSQVIDVKRPDGHTVRAYHATPPSTAPSTGAAVVLIHEWWGLNAHIEDVARRLAAAGFEVLAPDLYHGPVATTAPEAQRLSTELDGKDAVEQDVRGAVQHLAEAGKKVAVMGFCLGGALAMSSAVHVPELSAAVVFYGIPPEHRADPKDVRVPLLGHFAEQDDWCTPARVKALEEKLVAGKVTYELHRYPAEHAFFNDTRDIHDPASAKLAWDRTLDFLHRTTRK